MVRYLKEVFMIDKNMERILAAHLNLKSSNLQSIETATDKDGHPSIYVTLARNPRIFCPHDSSHRIQSNGYYTRRIVISDRLFEKTDVFLKVPRYYCKDCHLSFSEDFHMAPAGKTISYETVIKVMELLQDPHMTFREAAQLTGISVSSIVRIFDEHCHIPRRTFPEAVCVDEVYSPGSSFNDSDYVCIFYDFYEHKIIDVLPSRQKNYLHHYFQPFQGTGELNAVRFLIMDMHMTYKVIGKFYMKKAVICVDSFHVIKQLNDSLSKLRIRIMKRYNTDSIEYYLLKHWKFLLFDRTIDLDNKARYNKKLGRFINYRQLLDMILSIDPQLEMAWHLKERFTIFNATATYENATARLEELIRDFVLANIPEFQKFTTAISNWRVEIVNSFLMYKGRRVNNGVAESINAAIAVLLFNTRGIRNVERRRKRIMYAINKTGFMIK